MAVWIRILIVATRTTKMKKLEPVARQSLTALVEPTQNTEEDD